MGQGKDTHFESRFFPPVGWTDEFKVAARKINAAIGADDRAAARAAQEVLFHQLEALRRRVPYASGTTIKNARNELLRLYMVRGWHDLAAGVARLAIDKGLAIDKRCPNREAIVRQALARVLIEAGKLDEGEAEIRRAIRLSRTFLKGVRKARKLRPGLDLKTSQPHWRGLPPDSP